MDHQHCNHLKWAKKKKSSEQFEDGKVFAALFCQYFFLFSYPNFLPILILCTLQSQNFRLNLYMYSTTTEKEMFSERIWAGAGRRHRMLCINNNNKRTPMRNMGLHRWGFVVDSIFLKTLTANTRSHFPWCNTHIFPCQMKCLSMMNAFYLILCKRSRKCCYFPNHFFLFNKMLWQQIITFSCNSAIINETQLASKVEWWKCKNLKKKKKKVFFN